MLSKALVDEVDRLLREGRLSQRKIARQLGVSRGTVSAIATGRRELIGKDSSEVAQKRVDSPVGRCAKCGYRVYMPCLICGARELQHQRRVNRWPSNRERNVGS